jgi:hypothetical protein
MSLYIKSCYRRPSNRQIFCFANAKAGGIISTYGVDGNENLRRGGD